ncbi:MAG: cell division protein ZapA [Porphyrobacter sp.]|nr:cell division protein ZapA [Porphyrobacter sp.]
MSNVTVSIVGRSYTVACDPGQEGHISRLARSIDSKLKDIPNLAGQAESRALLFAALLLADELHELQSRAPAAAPTDDAQTAEALETLAEKLEGLAARLENATPNA